MPDSTGFIQLGFYGLTADEFETAFADASQHFDNEFIDYYKLFLYLRISRLSREHDLTLITTLRDGANNWLAEKIVRSNTTEPEDFIPMEVVVPKNPGVTPPSELEWSILKARDRLIHADGDDEAALQRCLLDVCEKLILATIKPEEHPLYIQAAEKGIPVECWNPADAISEYIRVRAGVTPKEG